MQTLDLDQLRRARARRRPSALAGALDKVREALAERTETLPAGPLLWVDFDGARPPCPVAAQTSLLEEQALPCGEFAGIVVCLQLAWLDFPTAIAECVRHLRPGGALMFATPGPDTLIELRKAWQMADPDYPHVHAFADMHDLGDALGHQGLTRVVLDVERTRLAYDDLGALLAAFKPAGLHNVLGDRRSGLIGRRRWQAFYRALEAQVAGDGDKGLSIEMVFGQAYRPEPKGQVRVAVPGH